jgi:hypothetical protein
MGIPGGSMGLGLGLEKATSIAKQKHRWLFYFTDISAKGIGVLPPAKSARPSMSFKELEVQHMNEIIFFPGKPEWKTISLSLYDICSTYNPKGEHPVMNWLKRLFDPESAEYGFVIDENDDANNFKLDATLELYDGCGNCLEKWIINNCWPQAVDFQDLDMGTSDVLLAEMTLRYDRAYITKNGCTPNTTY